MIFCLPSTLVLSRRKMCWKSSPAISDMVAALGGAWARAGGGRSGGDGLRLRG
uniref:40S ribosomal protein S18 n=1 Tax=Arundo donax TaxID=35708 RepID=A0A0A9EG20_ARUDO